MSRKPELRVWGAGTSRTFRVHWMLAELNLDYENRKVGPRTGETQTEAYKMINPKGKIPVLVHGDLVISESFAITRYLRRTFKGLTFDEHQSSSEGVTRFDELASFMLMELDATSLYIIRRHLDLAKIYGEAPNAVISAKTYFHKMLGEGLPKPALTEFVWGGCFSELDILLTTILDWADAVDIALPAHCHAYRYRMHERPGYRLGKTNNKP